nr:MAG TPA: hypothetical protein [Caudoviricetes sp.]
MEEIKIIHNENNSFTVSYKDKYADELCWEEMLGLIASLTISSNKPCQQWLRTDEEHEKFNQSLRKYSTV